MSQAHTPAERSSPSEHDFVDLAYLFMTFLYGAAVHLVIAEAHGPSDRSIVLHFITLGLILFLFSDWASRARLPRLLPETPAGYMYVYKICLEIICVFFLVNAFLRIVDQGDHHDSGITLPLPFTFGCFLLATACWDYLMIYIMKKLDMRPLARHVWVTGDAIDMKDTSVTYLGKFEAWKRRRSEEIEEYTRSVLGQIKGDSGNVAADIGRGLLRVAQVRSGLRVFEAVLASGTQVLANHVLHANAVAGASLILTATWLKRPPLDAFVNVFQPAAPLYRQLELNSWVSVSITATALLVIGCIVRRKGFSFIAMLSAASLIAVALFAQSAVEWLTLAGFVSVVFLASTLCYCLRETRLSNWTNRVAGWIIAGSLILLYVGLPSHLLIALLAAQQVLANAFLQLSVKKVSPGDLNGSDASASREPRPPDPPSLLGYADEPS